MWRLGLISRSFLARPHALPGWGGLAQKPCLSVRCSTMKRLFFPALVTSALLSTPTASAVTISFTDTQLAAAGGTTSCAGDTISDTGFSEGSQISTVTYTISGVDLQSVGGGVSETITIGVDRSSCRFSPDPCPATRLGLIVTSPLS